MRLIVAFGSDRVTNYDMAFRRSVSPLCCAVLFAQERDPPTEIKQHENEKRAVGMQLVPLSDIVRSVCFWGTRAFNPQLVLVQSDNQNRFIPPMRKAASVVTRLSC